MTKNDLLFRIHTIATTAVIAALPDPDKATVVKVADLFAAGNAKKVRTNTTDLTTLLDATATVATTLGLDPEAMVNLRVSLDAITKADPSATADFVATFGKDECHAWLITREVKVKGGKRASVATLNDTIKAAKAADFDDGSTVVEVNEKKRDEEDKAATVATEAAAVASGASSSDRLPACVVPTTTLLADRRHGRSRSKLTIEAPIPCVLFARDKEWPATIHPDASIEFPDGRKFTSPSRAMFETTLAEFGKGTNTSWSSFGWTDTDGTVKAIDALRHEPKGFEFRKPGSGRRRASGVKTAGRTVEACTARIERYTKQLDKAKADLVTAEAALVEKTKAEAAAAAAPVVVTAPEATATVAAATATPLGAAIVNVLGGAAKVAATLTTSAVVTPAEQRTEREAELRGMKKKALLAVAKSLNVKGRTSMKSDALLAAILSAEAASTAAA